MKRFLPLVLILCLLLGLCACETQEKSDASRESFEISFRTSDLPYEAEEPASVTVTKGGTVREPELSAEPTAGHIVIWTREEGVPNAYDFSQPVHSSFILYAMEIPKTYTITYLIEVGTNDKRNPATYTKDAETIRLKSVNTPFGYRFFKWSYFDDPDSAVTAIEKGTEGDIVLRAQVFPVEYRVLYADEGEVNGNPTRYTFGTTVSLDQAPTKEGYRFLGFTIYGDPAKTPVTELTPSFVSEHRAALFKANGSDIYLQANWEAIS